MKQIITILISFLLVATLQLTAQEEYSIASIPLDLLKNANSVILDEEIVVDVTKPGLEKVSASTVITVLNEKGLDDIATYIGYDNDTKVSSANIYIYNSKGEEIKHYKKRDFIDVHAVSGATLYSDSRVMFIRHTPASYPFTMKFNFEVESRTTAFLTGWRAVNDYASSTRRSVYKVLFDPVNKPRYRAENLEDYNITVSEMPGELIFEANDIMAIQFEDNAPTIQDIVPTVQIALDEFFLKGVYGNVHNWNQFGKWMDQNLLRSTSDLSEGTINHVKSLVKDETTNEAKARKIYKYVQDKVRYISIQIGIGGWKPMLASEVDKLSYGDCKALTNYTKALLDAVGVPSYYTVVYAGKQKRNISKEFTAMQGNHVILGVPDGDEITWLECTSQITPYGYLGSFTDDRDVLMITPEGGKIVRTKKYETSENVRRLEAVVNVEENLLLRGKIKATSRGIPYERVYFLENLKSDDLNMRYKKRWGHLNNFKPENIQFNNDVENIVFTENLNFTTTNYVSKAGDRLLLNPNIFSRYSANVSLDNDRSLPYEIQRGTIYKDEITIFLPEGFSVETQFEPIEILEPFGSYKASISNSEGKLVYKKELVIEAGKYIGDEYQAYLQFIKEVTRKDKSKIIISQQP